MRQWKKWGLLWTCLLLLGGPLTGNVVGLIHYFSLAEDDLNDTIHAEVLGINDPYASLVGSSVDKVDLGYVSFYSNNEPFGRIWVYIATVDLNFTELYFRFNQTNQEGDYDVFVGDMHDGVWVANVTTIRDNVVVNVASVTGSEDPTNDYYFQFVGNFTSMSNSSDYDALYGNAENTWIYGYAYRTAYSPDHKYEVDYINPQFYPLVGIEPELPLNWVPWAIAVVAIGLLGLGLRSYYSPPKEMCENEPERERCRFYKPPPAVTSFLLPDSPPPT